MSENSGTMFGGVAAQWSEARSCNPEVSGLSEHFLVVTPVEGNKNNRTMFIM